MSEFKAGDRVRVIDKTCDDGIYFGKVGTVTVVNERLIWPYDVLIQGVGSTVWMADELELVNE